MVKNGPYMLMMVNPIHNYPWLIMLRNAGGWSTLGIDDGWSNNGLIMINSDS